MSTLQARQHQSRADWLQRRRQGIGGSDVACILGLNPWKTALDVWAEKIGLSETEDNEQMLWGRRLETAILEELADRLGERIKKPSDEELPMVGRLPWQLVSPDGLMGRVLIEIKTASEWAKNEWGEEGTDEVPTAYALQVMWGLNALDLDYGIIAVLIGGQELRQYRIERNPDVEAVIVARCQQFWLWNVLRKVPPRAGSLDNARIAKVYGQATRALIAAPEGFDELVEELARIRSNDERREEIEATLKQAIGESGGLDGNGWKATWNTEAGRTRFDTDAAIAAGVITAADIARFSKQGDPIRKLRITTKKKG
jgi:putative phage-type endonuclease